MKTILIRNKDTGKETLGTMIVLDDLGKIVFQCYALERPWLDNKQNVSAIPTGTYKCVLTLSAKFKRYTYELMGVPGRSAIRIHSGNYFTDIEGCILLGKTLLDMNADGQLDVTNSKDTITQFEALFKGAEFTLRII